MIGKGVDVPVARIAAERRPWPVSAVLCVDLSPNEWKSLPHHCTGIAEFAINFLASRGYSVMSASCGCTLLFLDSLALHISISLEPYHVLANLLVELSNSRRMPFVDVSVPFLCSYKH